MSHLFLALIKLLIKKLDNVVKTIEEKLKTMQAEVKTDVQGLTKFVTLKSLSIDEKGNYSLDVSYHYKDGNGNVLNYEDPGLTKQTISGAMPDPTIAADQLTPEQIAVQSTSQAIFNSLAPVLTIAVPDAV